MSETRFRKKGLLFIGSLAVSGGRYEEVLRAALAGGAAAFMVREKELGGRELLELARYARAMTAAAGAQLIVSERLDVALAAGADGVHLPERSLAPDEARRVVGPRMLIGRSVHTLEGAREAARLGADYVMAGPVFATPGKEKLLPMETLVAMRRALDVDVVPVGGIDRANVGAVAGAGFDSAAVIRAVAAAADPGECAAALAAALERR